MAAHHPAAVQDLVLRPATAGDLADVAILYVLARAAAVPQLPPSVHPPAVQRAQVQAWDLGTHEVWVVEHPTRGLLGFARFTTTWLDDLYVHPRHRGSGIGSLLVQLVQALRPEGFGLWVFVSNTPARAFYARHGLREVGRSDGSENEEGAPEVELAWPGPGGR